MSPARNYRIAWANILNRSCAFHAGLESILLGDPSQNPFSTVSTQSGRAFLLGFSRGPEIRRMNYATQARVLGDPDRTAFRATDLMTVVGTKRTAVGNRNDLRAFPQMIY